MVSLRFGFFLKSANLYPSDLPSLLLFSQISEVGTPPQIVFFFWKISDLALIRLSRVNLHGDSGFATH